MSEKKIKLPLSFKKLYEMAYAALGDATPIPVDCGQLCDRACCRVEEEITGMYLFPEENVMLRDMPDYMHLYDTDFEYDYGRYADLLTCDGHCERERRPLACRIFPLLPYLHEDGRCEIIVDPRGKGICPMAKTMTLEDFEPEFVDGVRRCVNILLKNNQIRQFIHALSRQLDELKL
ncbi:MAG: hypothetical protein J1F63_09345 [Oscillospiraceae bacterium]|nr:hypothetical protein [Oscillospiraceae bacterium]